MVDGSMYWNFPLFMRAFDIVRRSGPPAGVEVRDAVPAETVSVPENEYSILDHNIVINSPMVEYLGQYKMKQAFPPTTFDSVGMPGHSVLSGAPIYKNILGNIDYYATTLKPGEGYAWEMKTLFDAYYTISMYDAQRNLLPSGATQRAYCDTPRFIIPEGSKIVGSTKSAWDRSMQTYTPAASLSISNPGDNLRINALTYCVFGEDSKIYGTSPYNDFFVKDANQFTGNYCEDFKMASVIQLKMLTPTSQIIGNVTLDMMGAYNTTMKLHYLDSRGIPLSSSTINMVAGAANHSLYSRSEKYSDGTLKALKYYLASANNVTRNAITIEKNQYYSYPQWPRRDGAVRGIIFEQIAPTGLLRAIRELPDEIETYDVARDEGTSTDQRMIIT